MATSTFLQVVPTMVPICIRKAPRFNNVSTVSFLLSSRVTSDFFRFSSCDTFTMRRPNAVKSLVFYFCGIYEDEESLLALNYLLLSL